jgi:hypothetical protein
MRIRTTAAMAVVSGALALTCAAIPAAQASGAASAHQDWRLAQQTHAAHPTTAARAFAATGADDGVPYALDVTFSNVKVNSGKAAVAVGTTNTVHVPYSFTLTATNVDVSAPDFIPGVDLYRGSADAPDNDLFGDDAPSCAVTSSTSSSDGVVTTENCTGTVDIYPQVDLADVDAGAHWHAVAWAVAFNGQDPSDPDLSQVGEADLTGLAAPALQRYSRLTVNASPEPVVKGGTVTVTGALTRANWDTHKYAGYTVQPVKLQFRKKGTTTYSTLKTVTSDSHGNLRTTYKASVDGYWRYSFAGTSTTPAVSATGDYVDVR